MENYLSAILGMVAATAGFAIWQWFAWRRLALRYKAFINDPNVKAVDKQQAYKDTYEAQVNALSEERRQIDVAMNEVFDVLNEEANESDDPRLMQCRNVLLKAIQISTYGRGE